MRIRRLTDFIGEALDDYDLQLKDLAEIACLSPAQLMRSYRARTGEAPMQTLRRLRLQRAYVQLAGAEGGNVTQIAFAAGYDSNAAFTHAFRRQFGLAPSQLRARPPAAADGPPPLGLVHLPERKVWQFRYTGHYADNGHAKARLAWLCLRAGWRRWRGWRLNDRDHPFTERAEQRVDLGHFIPADRPLFIPEADLLTHPAGLYAAVVIDPRLRETVMTDLTERIRSELGCRPIEGHSLERDLHIRDHRPPQDRRIALYLPVAPLRD